MNRTLTAAFAALEAALVVGIGIGIPLLPLTILWAVQYGFGGEWVWFWRAAVDFWLIGHGVDITFVLDPVVAAGLGVAGAGGPVTVTIAALGVGLLTGVLGVRAGARVAEARYRGLGQLVCLVTFAVLSLLVTWSALSPAARPSLWQGTLLPTVVFAVGLIIGIRRVRPEVGAPIVRAVGEYLSARPPLVRDIAATALRGGAAAAALVLAAAALAFAASLALNYARIISLYESLQTAVLGGITLTLAQLAIVPNVVVFAASWLIGPGFALGTGSAISPLGTSVGPIPAIPILGALPASGLTFGFVGLLVPVLAGFLVGAALGPRLRRSANTPMLAVAGGAIGLVAGIILAALAAFSAGSAGPGRLVDVGPNPWAVLLWATLEIGLAATIGLLSTVARPAGRRDPRR